MRLCAAALLIGGALTRPNPDWYVTLAKPGFAPPNSVFPVVWPILYALMAISAWLAWCAPGKEEDRKLAMIWFFIQLAIGVLWSVAFFVMHSPAAGLGVIMAFLVAIAITIVFLLRHGAQCGDPFAQLAMSERSVLVTGCSSGIGLRRLARVRHGAEA